MHRSALERAKTTPPHARHSILGLMAGACGSESLETYEVPSLGMADTIDAGAKVVVDEKAYTGDGFPARFDVVVHIAGGDASSSFVHRVVALPGETVEGRDNQLSIDDVVVLEPHLPQGSRMPDFGPETVPDGHPFLLGDNRIASRDSRAIGPVALGDIIGRVVEIRNP